MDYQAEIRDSLNREDSDVDWWDRAHSCNHKMWLSGTGPEEIWQRLGVSDRIVATASVLNIGVGLGYCTHALNRIGCEVSVLDISELALARVQDVAKGYRADGLNEIPSRSFDLALSHLVAQHMYDEDLGAQINHVVRALKPTGVFALHYAAPLDGSPPNVNTPKHSRGGGILREPSFMAGLAIGAGARILSDEPKEVFPGCEWRVIQLAPRSEPSA